MEDDSKKELIIFGKDISKIPCFRNSFFYGISGGLGLGLIQFLLTSKPLKSVNFSVYSFSVITLVYWIQCRYNYSKQKFEMLRLQEIMRNHSILGDTEDSTSIMERDVDAVEV